MTLLFAGCSEAGEVSDIQEEEISQETAVESADALNLYV